MAERESKETVNTRYYEVSSFFHSPSPCVFSLTLNLAFFFPPCLYLSHCQQLAYEEAVSGFVEGGSARDKTSGLTRDDRIHGSLLVINELIMNSSFPDEVN